MFCKKSVLRNFAKFTVKHLCQSFFFNKVVGLRRATSLKKRLWHWSIPVNFAKFLRKAFIIEHLVATSEPIAVLTVARSEILKTTAKLFLTIKALLTKISWPYK